VQVRQKIPQKKTLFYLEQLLIKYEATKDCIGIKPVSGKDQGSYLTY
jgi:nonsense-mediated mRNA decay protein 3